MTYDNVIAIPAGITKLGAKGLILTAANSYSGTTTVNAGLLEAVNGSALGTNSPVRLANVAGAELSIFNTSLQIGSLTGGGTTGGNVNLGSGSPNSVTLFIGSDNTSPPAFAGIISGPGSLTKTGAGVLTLSAPTHTRVTPK